ncbi:MAG: nucleotide-binding universal stress UspA family protein [Ilumatobacter sp.]|jgi:nucleotide-binding universal stress UspA family protein
MSIVDVLDSTHVDEQPLIVGVDGSPESERGLRFASAMAVKLDVELVAVHALGMYSHLAGWRAPIEGHELEAASLLHDRWCARLDDVGGLRWSWQIVQGAAVAAILRVADEVDAGFIVIGSHGAGNSEQPLLGSTSHWVVRNSHRPVIIVPPAGNHRHRRLGSAALTPSCTVPPVG